MQIIRAKIDWAITHLNALTLRERVIILVVMLVVLLGIYDQFALTPYLDANKKADLSMKSHVAQINENQAKIDALIERMQKNPNLQIEQQISQSNEKIKDIDKLIDSFTENLIAPQKMSQILGSLLSKKSGMDVVSVKSFPVEPIIFKKEVDADKENPEQKKVEPTILMYKHRMQFELKGSFFQVSDYLRMIENLKERLYWDNMDFKINKYPQGVFILDVHTLSLSKEFIGVYN